MTLLMVTGVAAIYLLPNRSGADASNIELVRVGGQIYATHCASCHGSQLEGQPDWRERRPDGRLPAPPHDASEHSWHHSDRQLFKITKGVSGTIPGYQIDMPAYQQVLSDREIGAVLAYIKRRWPAHIRERQKARSGQEMTATP